MPERQDGPPLLLLVQAAAVTLDEATARELARAAKQAKTWIEKRDAIIRAAVASGAGVREVARAVGLTHPSIIKIVRKEQSS